MTDREMLLKQKMSLLELAKMLGNIKKACAVHNVSRQHYYNVKENYEKNGIEGLQPKERSRPNMPNQYSEVLEKTILQYTMENPSFGKDRATLELRMQGVYVTVGGVESVWKRHKMLNKKERFKKLEELTRKNINLLSYEQIRALVENAQCLEEQHVISYYPGYLLCQDTYEVGIIKGVGKIYMQTVIDTYGSFAFGKLYTSKESLTAADILIDRVLPFYNALALPIHNILTDNGREYCGDQMNHNYEIVLKLFQIKHRTTKVARPQSNGFAERFNRTACEEFFAVAFRKKWYYNLEELQYDFDEWLDKYNFKRSHQGYRVKGRKPIEVLLDMSNRPKLLTL